MQDGSSASSSIKLHLTANNEHASIHFIFHTHTYAHTMTQITRVTIHVCIVDIGVSVRMTRIGGKRKKKKKLKNRVGERKGERERDR